MLKWNSRRLLFAVMTTVLASALVWFGKIGPGDWARVVEVVTASYLGARAVEHISQGIASRKV